MLSGGINVINMQKQAIAVDNGLAHLQVCEESKVAQSTAVAPRDRAPRQHVDYVYLNYECGFKCLGVPRGVVV